MANIENTVDWVDQVYEIALTDPVQGGQHGPLNRAAEGLVGRTGYLKTEQDLLKSRMQAYEQESSPDVVMSAAAVVELALAKQSYIVRDLINERVRSMQSMQGGEVVIFNRGVIKGCSVSMSVAGGIRNLGVADGTVFMGSRIMPFSGADPAAVIPFNPTNETAVCWCYLREVEGQMVPTVGPPDEEPPEDALTLAKITIPPGNTSVSDPRGTEISISDQRRLETAFPKRYASAPFAEIALEWPYPDVTYGIVLDVVSYTSGSGYQQGGIYVGDRARNGFKIYTNGAVDTIRIHWMTTRRTE